MLTSSLRAVLQVMEAIKPVSREITKETVKTIRAGNAGTCRPTLGGLTRVLSIFRTRGCGCARRARHSLRPLNFGGRCSLQNSEAICLAGVLGHVIAGTVSGGPPLLAVRPIARLESSEASLRVDGNNPALRHSGARVKRASPESIPPAQNQEKWIPGSRYCAPRNDGYFPLSFRLSETR